MEETQSHTNLPWSGAPRNIQIPGQFECLALAICLGDNSSLMLAGNYRPPSASALGNLFDQLSKYTPSQLLIVGDANIDWLGPHSNKLKYIFNDFHLTQLITKPTRPNGRDAAKSTLLDMILTDHISIQQLPFFSFCK